MESLDRRTFVQAAVGGALTAAVLAVPSAQVRRKIAHRTGLQALYIARS